MAVKSLLRVNSSRARDKDATGGGVFEARDDFSPLPSGPSPSHAVVCVCVSCTACLDSRTRRRRYFFSPITFPPHGFLYIALLLQLCSPVRRTNVWCAAAFAAVRVFRTAVLPGSPLRPLSARGVSGSGGEEFSCEPPKGQTKNVFSSSATTTTLWRAFYNAGKPRGAVAGRPGKSFNV